jgi:hypothetical protein
LGVASREADAFDAGDPPLTNSVAKRSPASEAQIAATMKGRALMGGSSAMRDAGKEYLPKFGSESEEGYQARLKWSWLFNGYRKTVKDMTGRVFDTPVIIADGAPSEVGTWAGNIDLQGNDLSTFARRVFEDAIGGAGISYIMVDAPQREGVVTQAQARASNLRPYFIHLRAEDVLGWKVETHENAPRLSQFRVMETVTETDPQDEFQEVEIAQVRVYDLIESRVQVRLYRQNDKHEWIQAGGPYVSDIDEITVVPFYANRSGFFTGSPLLDDLADVNIAHWQSQSDQRNILHFARVPVFVRTGWSDEDSPLVLGAAEAMSTSNPDAKAAWVEHSGAAIGAGRQDLKDLEFQMETHGLQLLAAKPGRQSATGEALDAAKETSTLAMTADQLQDALEQAFVWALKYAGLAGDVSVTVNKDFGVNAMGAQELTALLSAVNTGNMSRETFLREMVRRGMVASDMDVDDEMERLADGVDLTVGAE